MADGPAPEPGSPSFSSAVNGGKTLEECQDMIQRSLRIPMVKFLLKQFEQAGCGLGTGSSRPFIVTSRLLAVMPAILVCGNHMNIQDEVNQVVIHELIHAFDDCRAANLNWANCAHHACSEIRAGHLSGDCHYKRELLRGFVKIRGHEQDCVRRRVMKSVIANPYCSEAAAKDAMEAVWDVSPTGDLMGFLGPEDGPEAEVEAFGGGVVGFFGPEDGPEAEVEAFGGRVVGFLGPEEVGELAGAALVDGDGAVLGEADGEEAEDLGDDAGAEDVDLALFEEAGPLAGDDDGDLDLADGDGALAFAATPEIMATKMRVRTIT
ncbi:hypothetical protein GBA52_011817 [Prunus armeniaca]|nr:hypothetical protein GBA52_011817 [Prunus armeniaca]